MKGKHHIVVAMAGVAVLVTIRRPASLPRAFAGVSVATLILLLIDAASPPLASAFTGLVVGSVISTPPYPQIMAGIPAAVAQIFEDIAAYEPQRRPFGQQPSTQSQAVPVSLRSTGDTDGLAPEMVAAIRCVEQASGRPLHITSGYRSSAEQAELYRRYKEGRGPLAAPPGRSRHEQGRAIDVDSESQRILEQYGAACGLRRTVPGEPWHWEV